jgi:hypothetical protein
LKKATEYLRRREKDFNVLGRRVPRGTFMYSEATNRDVNEGGMSERVKLVRGCRQLPKVREVRIGLWESMLGNSKIKPELRPPYGRDKVFRQGKLAGLLEYRSSTRDKAVSK